MLFFFYPLSDIVGSCWFQMHHQCICVLGWRQGNVEFPDRSWSTVWKMHVVAGKRQMKCWLEVFLFIMIPFLRFWTRSFMGHQFELPEMLDFECKPDTPSRNTGLEEKKSELLRQEDCLCGCSSEDNLFVLNDCLFSAIIARQVFIKVTSLSKKFFFTFVGKKDKRENWTIGRLFKERNQQIWCFLNNEVGKASRDFVFFRGMYRRHWRVIPAF